MRKLFLLIPAFLLSMLANAADQYPDPSVENSLSAAVIAVGDGETIYLDDATPYFNVKKEGVDYATLSSNHRSILPLVALMRMMFLSLQ